MGHMNISLGMLKESKNSLKVVSIVFENERTSGERQTINTQIALHILQQRAININNMPEMVIIHLCYVNLRNKFI